MLIDWLRLGGWPMALLLALSLLASTVILVKFWEIWEWRRTRGATLSRSLEAWRLQRPEQARAQLASQRTPVAEVLTAAMDVLSDPGMSAEAARERVEQIALQTLERMRGGLRLLELIAQLAPLLGLFGTVLGMIAAFRGLEGAGGTAEPALLAGGIWQALLTTAAGLAIAMPVMAALHALEQAVERQRLALEAALTELMTRPRRPLSRAA